MPPDAPTSVDLRQQIEACLQSIIDPCSAANGTNFSLVEMGLVKEVQIDEGEVCVKLRLTSPACFMLEFFLTEIRARVGSLPGVRSVDVQSDGGFEWEPSMMDQGRRRSYLDALRRALPVVSR